MNYVMKVMYDGTDFFGWQIQPGFRTVQGVMQKAAKQIFGCETPVQASGRTDTGVHACGQIVQFSAETNIPGKKLRECFNRLLPDDVKVLCSEVAPENFDCTRASKRKTYCYSAYYAPCELPLVRRYAVRLTQKPNVSRMREAAKLLLGEHDFAAFRASGYTSKTSVRTVYRAEVSEEKIEGGILYRITFTGNGFLYNMVRIAAGELFAIGCGKEEGITRAFASGSRNALAKTMPPQGLTMLETEYETALFGFLEE